MVCYIKDKHTFKNKYYGQCTYDVTVQSIYDEVSTVTIPGAADIAAGDYVFVAGFAGIVTQPDIESGSMVLNCEDINRIFHTPLFLPDTMPDVAVEDFIENTITQNYIEEFDEMFRLPYLRVDVLTKTYGIQKPDSDDDGFWNLKSYMAKVRRMQDVFTSFFAEGNTLAVTIGRRIKPTHKIDLGLSHFHVVEESYTDEQAAKITVLAEDTGEVSDWYLLEDGTVTKEYTTERRIDGTREKLKVENANDAEAEVKNRFKENSKSHIVEFMTTREYGIYDDVLLRTQSGRVLTSSITAIRKMSGTDMVTYKTGELRLMIDEKLNILFGGLK